MKEELKRYKDFKDQYNFAGRRDRQLKHGWRHGILGVENPDDPGTEIYKETQMHRNYQNDHIDHISGRRYNSKQF